MDESPYAQLLAHAQKAASTRQAAADAAHQLAAEAEASRPSPRPPAAHQEGNRQP